MSTWNFEDVKYAIATTDTLVSLKYGSLEGESLPVLTKSQSIATFVIFLTFGAISVIFGM